MMRNHSKKSIGRKAVPLIVSGLLCILLIFLRPFLLAAGTIAEVRGFALDAQEKLYIGVGERILVYTEGEKTGALRLHIPYSFCFYIEEDRLVVGGPKRNTAVYDLDGNFLSYSEQSYEEVLSTARERKTVERNGNVYSFEGHFGLHPTEILCNGDAVYRMPLLDFLFTGFPFAALLAVAGLCLAFSIVLFVTDTEGKAYLERL